MESQSPSLRGSGRFGKRLIEYLEENGLSQSPSLQGSGRFPLEGHPCNQVSCLNPLHCGAVVASASTVLVEIQTVRSLNPLHCGAVVASSPMLGTVKTGHVSIPFIAGQWSLLGERAAWRVLQDVSIPFIAGQWSLPYGGRGGKAKRGKCLNPLHCGAVVASGNPPAKVR